MIKKQVDADIIAARKSKDTLTLARLTQVKVPFDAIAKANPDAPESDYVTALTKVVKQYRETRDFAEKGGRLVAATEAENNALALEGYLPKSLTEDEVEVLLHSVAKENSLDITKKNMGMLVNLTVAKSGGATNGKTVSTILNGLLTQYSA